PAAAAPRAGLVRMQPDLLGRDVEDLCVEPEELLEVRLRRVVLRVRADRSAEGKLRLLERRSLRGQRRLAARQVLEQGDRGELLRARADPAGQRLLGETLERQLRLGDLHLARLERPS